MENLTFEQRFSSFCDYITQITGLPVLKAKEAFTPQFNSPFVSISIVNIQLLPNDLKEYKDIGIGLQQNIRGLSLVSFQIQVFGKGSRDKLLRFLMSFGSDIWANKAYQIGFGISSKSELSNINAVLTDAVYEERYSATVDFYISIPNSFDVDYFDHVDIHTIANQEDFGIQTIPSKGELR